MDIDTPEESKHLTIAKNLKFIHPFFDEFTASKIPRILHLIWVGNQEKPFNFDFYILEWKRLMPNWEIRVWENKDINNFEFAPEILSKINISLAGAQKADIMRYSIIEKYGGYYMDADMIPIKSLETLQNFKEDLIICHDMPISWEYISIGFFGSIKNHPVIKKACELCLSAELNTPDLHLKTGPHLFGHALNTTKLHEKEKIIVLHPKAFYHNEEFLGTRFASHTYAKMW